MIFSQEALRANGGVTTKICLTDGRLSLSSEHSMIITNPEQEVYYDRNSNRFNRTDNLHGQMHQKRQ
jgi:hypothetical protein